MYSFDHNGINFRFIFLNLSFVVYEKESLFGRWKKCGGKESFCDYAQLVLYTKWMNDKI